MAQAAKHTMSYVRLGKSGLKVSRLILGCSGYGSPKWQGWVLGEEEAIKHIKAAYDLGIQTFDTAYVSLTILFSSAELDRLGHTYSNGLSEVVLGKAIKQHDLPREEIVVMTKVFGPVARQLDQSMYGVDVDRIGYVNQHGLSRKHIFKSVKHSFSWTILMSSSHRFDPNTPIEETIQALHDVVKAGYVRYIGMSSCYAWQFHVMQNYAINNHLTPFISMQNHYNLLYREEEREMMPTLEHFGVGSIPWSPLARSHLTRPFGEDSARTPFEYWANLYGAGIAKRTITDRVEELAKKKGMSMAQLSLAWLLQKDVVSAPIVGVTSVEKLHGLVGALDVKLSAQENNFLEEAYQPQSILGH